MGKRNNVIGELEFIVCSTINGDKKNCKRDWCGKCSFRLPRLNEVKTNVLKVVLDEIDYLSNDGEFTLTNQEIRDEFEGGA